MPKEAKRLRLDRAALYPRLEGRGFTAEEDKVLIGPAGSVTANQLVRRSWTFLSPLRSTVQLAQLRGLSQAISPGRGDLCLHFGEGAGLISQICSLSTSAERASVSARIPPHQPVPITATSTCLTLAHSLFLSLPLPKIHHAAYAQGKPFILAGAMRDWMKLSTHSVARRRQRRSSRAPAATDARPSAGRIRSIAASSRYLRASSTIRKMIVSALLHHKNGCQAWSEA